ncbi:reverse transcriptase domain-containing protein [Tanacetum coccineum]|uniref:Reverse transcriptase domain-containing protein n=1 Tax=Tanacetum coccineum TaxID=301880 RepID=A0ABQ5CTL6_9ASTR
MATLITMAPIAPSTHRGVTETQSLFMKLWQNNFRARHGLINLSICANVKWNSSTQAVSSDVAELKDIVRALLLDKKNQASAPAPAPAPVKAVELSCVTCGGAHSHQNCPATHGNVYRDNISEYVSQAAAANYNQVSSNFRPQMVANHIRPPGFPPVQNSQANNANNFNRGNNFNQNRESNFNQNRGGNFNQSNFSQNQLHRPQVNQSPAYQAPVPQTHSVTKNDFDNYVKANDAIMRNMQNNLQNQGQSMQIETNKLNNQMANLTDMLAKFVTANTASTSGSGTLPGNTVTNPREDLKGITTRSGVAYRGPPIPTSSVVKPIPEVTKDQVHPSCSQSTAPVQPPVGPEPIVEPIVAPVPNTKPSVSLPYPSRRDNEKSRNQANEQIDKFYEIFKEMSFEISFTDALVLMPKFASTLRTLLGNKEKLTEVARTSNEPCLARTSMNEHCSGPSRTSTQKLGKDHRQVPNSLSGKSFHFLTYSNLHDTRTCGAINFLNPMGNCKRQLVKTSRALIDVNKGELTLRIGSAAITYNLDQLRDTPPITLTDGTMMTEPPPPLPNHKQYMPGGRKELELCEAKTIEPSVHEPPEVELKELPPHLEYAFLEGDNKLPVIIAKEVSHPEFCTHIDHMEEYAPAANIKEDPWVSPCTCVPKKEGNNCEDMELSFMDDFSCLGFLSKTVSPVIPHLQRSYLIMNKSIVHTDHSALKYLFAKKDAQARLLRWVLLLQEFDFKVIDTKGAENSAADQLSRLEKLHNVMICLKTHPVCKSLTFGASRLMGPFPTSRVNKYISWQSTICPKVVEAKALPPMMPSANFPQGSINPCDGSSDRDLNKALRGGTHAYPLPDCGNSQFLSFIKSFHILSFILESDILRSGYQQKDRKPSQNDKTEHGMEKTVKNQGQRPKKSKSKSIQKNQQSNRSRN